jgi:hypothetical protein
MGEAKRRREAFAEARAYRPPRVCPNCKSICIERTTLPPTALSHRETAYDLCRECATVWEAYPDDWCEDVVGADPCDNCAFRPGSPEQQDPEGWKELVATLKSGQEFRCHKGAPICGLDKSQPNDKGNFDIEFDAKWVQKHGRKCAGFMRLVWAMRDKGEDWTARHFEFCGAPGYDMPLPKDDEQELRLPGDSE